MINKSSLLGFSLILFHKGRGEGGESLRKRASRSYRVTEILRVRESSNPELHFSDGGAGLASLAAVCSFEHLSHGGTTLAFHPGCYFKARMPLFLMLTKFVRAALG